MQVDYKNLKINEVYRIRHSRKGRLYGRLLAIVDGDEYDLFFLKVIYDTRPGTDQERLRYAADTRISQLRPSLIEGIERVDGEHWLRQVVIPEEHLPKEEKKGFFANVMSKVKGR